MGPGESLGGALLSWALFWLMAAALLGLAHIGRYPLSWRLLAVIVVAAVVVSQVGLAGELAAGLLQRLGVGVANPEYIRLGLVAAILGVLVALVCLGDARWRARRLFSALMLGAILGMTGLVHGLLVGPQFAQLGEQRKALVEKALPRAGAQRLTGLCSVDGVHCAVFGADAGVPDLGLGPGVSARVGAVHRTIIARGPGWHSEAVFAGDAGPSFVYAYQWTGERAHLVLDTSVYQGVLESSKRRLATFLNIGYGTWWLGTVALLAFHERRWRRRGER